LPVPNTLQYPLERKALADSGIREDANEHGGARQSDELRPVLLRAITH
jgi:hypothetical protein